jgi:aspartate kinase
MTFDYFCPTQKENKMIVYKFGGASVKNAQAVMKISKIIGTASQPLIVVVSAMGKTTNRLEAFLDEGLKGSGKHHEILNELKTEHIRIIKELIPDPAHPIYNEVEGFFQEAAALIQLHRNKDYNFIYDQVIPLGELISTKIVNAWLVQAGITSRWIDIREILKTDSNYREAIIDHTVSEKLCRSGFAVSDPLCFVTQGFIGSDSEGFTTTLGREGSDYSAALLANYLDSESVTLWKDVDGIYNADPAIFSNVNKIEALSYQEVIELTYYGAKVIHPKTIRPLFDKQIPLFVKSFNNPENDGSIVGKSVQSAHQQPIIIILENQVLISISKKDLSFISELNLSFLFDLLHTFRLKANLMQHSAVSFSICVDIPKGKALEELIELLQKEFKLLYNTGLKLITIRNYNIKLITELIGKKEVLVEQRSRQTAQFIVV